MSRLLSRTLSLLLPPLLLLPACATKNISTKMEVAGVSSKILETQGEIKKLIVNNSESDIIKIFSKISEGAVIIILGIQLIKAKNYVRRQSISKS